MKNNLLKTVAVIAIAVAMLATSVTSFAATASTVTTYNEGTSKLHVVSTVSDVDAGVMVTYLATKKGSVSSNEDIVYIGQETAAGSPIVFSYDAPSAAITSAKLLYGSNLSDVATALNGDPNNEVSVAGVTVTGTPEGTVITVTDSQTPGVVTDKLGNNEEGSIEIDLPDFYELKSVKVDGNVIEDVTTNAFPVKGGSEVVVECVYIATSKVELDGAKEYFVQEIGEGDVTLDTVGLVCKINGTGTGYTYGVYAEKSDGTAFELEVGGAVEGEETPLEAGFYPAVINAEDGGYYAVQLAAEEGALNGVKLYPYYNNGTENIICK
jgi:hypothetical protein